ncbi:hypothetical protein ICNINCKA_00152 [Synechococcus sp. CBW1107]|nr:hypothetical protein ICNINCKA_00152 [Synechococcus sp. CBW1107]
MRGGKQFGFGDYEQSTAKKRTRRERFLAEMEAVVPWSALIDLIKPHYPKTSSKGGRPPYPLETMLRIHLMQQWYSLSDPAMEDALIEVPRMRRFAGIKLDSDRIVAETTTLKVCYRREWCCDWAAEPSWKPCCECKIKPAPGWSRLSGLPRISGTSSLGVTPRRPRDRS